MITLFRRIRQKLIDSGSVTKYLLYAIGEILLVSIGKFCPVRDCLWVEILLPTYNHCAVRHCPPSG